MLHESRCVGLKCYATDTGLHEAHYGSATRPRPSCTKSKDDATLAASIRFDTTVSVSLVSSLRRSLT